MLVDLKSQVNNNNDNTVLGAFKQLNIKKNCFSYVASVDTSCFCWRHKRSSFVNRAKSRHQLSKSEYETFSAARGRIL